MSINIARKIIEDILKDTSAIKLVLLSSLVSVICFSLSFVLGLLTLLASLAAVLLSILLDNEHAQSKVQNVIKAILSVKLTKKSPDADPELKVDQELDQSIERFFNRIIQTFISSWYSNITQDETFTGNLKEEISEAIKQIALRIQGADHPRLISNKLLPVVYSHIEILERLQNERSPEDQIRSFVSNENSVHPAVFSRSSEKNYLRHLTKGLLQMVTTRKNYECKIIVNLLREVLSCSVLLPLTDVLSDPAIIDLLVIIATNPKDHKAAVRTANDKRVVLLENFVKQFQMNLYDEDDEAGDKRKIDENFFRDQEKLYTFMQHLKSKSNTDIDLLKFYLDVEHMNSELEKMSVITDPVALSLLQQKSEKLLKFYQCQLFQEYNEETKPSDLLQAHAQARKILEEKWRTDFYKSAEYFQLIYGDQESSNSSETAKFMDTTDGAMSHQKMSAKFKHVLNMRGTVDGIEATEIPVWDALDHPLGNSSYYNSVAVKLRKERGQDLDSFMHAFFLSIEQDTDVGEDVALMHFVDERAKARLKMKLKNAEKGEIYKNLFNIPLDARREQYWTFPLVKSASESVVYFLDSILNVPKVVLRATYGVLRVLPDADDIICEVIGNFLKKILDQPTLAKLIKELEEKVFDTDSTEPPCPEELERRHNLAITRLGSINKNSVKILSFLQNPVLNKHLVYCLIDTIAVELFPELNLEAKDC